MGLWQGPSCLGRQRPTPHPHPLMAPMGPAQPLSLEPQALVRPFLALRPGLLTQQMWIERVERELDL